MPRNDRDRDDRRDDRGRNDDRDRGRERNRDDDRGGGRSDFKYAGRTAEDVSRAAKESSSRYDKYLDCDAPWFKPHDGENQIRIIPWVSGNHPDFDKLVEKYGRKIGINIVTHGRVGVDKGTYLCLDKTLGEPCPICDVWREESVEDLKPSDRMLVWLIDRKAEKTGPQLWSMPLGTSKDINAASQVRGKGGADGEVLLIDDPNEGYDLFFDREGVKDRTRYVRFETDRDPSPLHDKQERQDQWLDYVTDNCLPDLLKTYEPDYLEKVLSGQVSKRENDDGDGDNDRSSRRPSSRDRGGGRDDDRDRDRGDRDSSRGRSRGARGDDGDGAEGEFTRPARRVRGGDPEDAPADDRGEDGGERSERGSGRSTRRGGADDGGDSGGGRSRGRDREPDPEPEPERGSTRGGKTERYRGKGGADDDRTSDDDKDGDGDVAAAKERLGNVGRRGRRG
jgi:gp32 DNA binding protein like